MNRENSILKSFSQEAEDNKIAPIEKTEQGPVDPKALELAEKGYFKNSQEAGEFMAELSETMRAASKAEEQLEAFQAKLEAVLKEAEEHLASLEMDHDDIGKSDTFRDIARQIGINYKEVQEWRSKGPQKKNFAQKLGEIVRNNRKALIAFSVFSAALRLGGGAMNAEASHHDVGDFNHFDPVSEFGNHEHQIDVNSSSEGMNESEFTQMEGINFSADDANSNSIDEINSSLEMPNNHDSQMEIDNILSEINDSVDNENVFVADLANGESSGEFNLHDMQKTLAETGKLQMELKSYTEVNEGMCDKYMMAVSQLHEVANSSNENMEPNMNISAEGNSPEEATLAALAQINDTAGLEIVSETQVDSQMLESDHVESAAKNSVEINSIDIHQESSVDDSGQEHIKCVATLSGHRLNI